MGITGQMIECRCMEMLHCLNVYRTNPLQAVKVQCIVSGTQIMRQPFSIASHTSKDICENSPVPPSVPRLSPATYPPIPEQFFQSNVQMVNGTCPSPVPLAALTSLPAHISLSTYTDTEVEEASMCSLRPPPKCIEEALGDMLLTKNGFQILENGSANMGIHMYRPNCDENALQFGAHSYEELQPEISTPYGYDEVDTK